MKYLIVIFSFITNTSFAGDDIIFINGFEVPTSGCVEEIVFEEYFDGADQSGWNGQWQESGNSVDLVEIISNEGRLIPITSGYSLARMYHPLDEKDLDVSFSFTFENGATQGVGFYVRSNGGYLQQTNPRGEGYAVFVERFTGQAQVGLWYEHNGQESSIIREPNAGSDMLDDISYNVRFQIYQVDNSTTMLRARTWAQGQLEPNIWNVSEAHTYVPLQNTLGGIAVDSWSTQTNGQINNAIRIDDIVVSRLCN